jgi:urease accessory protein UreE
MINVLDLRPGDKLQLQDGALAEVVENMEDGMWVQVRTLAPNGSDEETVELCHAQDIIKVLSRSDSQS